MKIKKYWMILAMALTGLCTTSCGSDDDDVPSNNPTNLTEQKVQLNYTDNFYLGNTLCGWNFNARGFESCITSVSAKLYFYITDEKEVSKIKLPSVSVRLWRNEILEGNIIGRWCIVAVESSSESYEYYCIYTDRLTDSSNAILGSELTIYRIM